MMAAANSLSEKARNLPLLCVETICKFTPTSKLIRLYSHDVPLPGASWELALDTVLRKRLPFTVGADPLSYQADDDDPPTAVFDAASAKVTRIKQPEALRYAAIVEFIESAALTVRATPWMGGLELFVPPGQAVFSALPRVTKLYLVLSDVTRRSLTMKDFLKHLLPHLKHLLPQLETFVIRCSRKACSNTQMDEIVDSFIELLPIRDMTSLRRLDLPEPAFHRFSQDKYVVRHILSGLGALGILRGFDSRIGAFPRRRLETLNVMATYCRQVSTLAVVIHGEFKAYLDAFRALTGLNTLCLDLDYEIRFQGLTFDASNVISSVLDLRLLTGPYVDRVNMCKVAAFFPNTKAFALETRFCGFDPLNLAMSVFGERQFFPAVARLTCLSSDEGAGELLTEFLANPHLPETVDLLKTIFKKLARDANLLTTIYCIMQRNSIKSLLFRGPMNREALPRLQSHIDLNGEDAKVSAWKDRDFGPLSGSCNLAKLSEQTDFKIIGSKTSGSLKGQQFTIRVFHPLVKRFNMFD